MFFEKIMSDLRVGEYVRDWRGFYTDLGIAVALFLLTASTYSVPVPNATLTTAYNTTLVYSSLYYTYYYTRAYSNTTIQYTSLLAMPTSQPLTTAMLIMDAVYAIVVALMFTLAMLFDILGLGE